MNFVHQKCAQKRKIDTSKNRDFGRFLKQQFYFCSAAGTKKLFFHQTNVRNVFRNIELALGYNIVTLEHVLRIL